LSIDRDNMFSPDSHNSRKNHTPNPRSRNNHKACIHCQKSSWGEARPVLDHPIALSKSVLSSMWPIITTIP
jgi:hypothetical protein